MSFYNQTILGIERVIKKRASEHRFDKYFLATSEVSGNQQAGDSQFLRSSWEHSFDHFMTQLTYFTNRRRETDLNRSLKTLISTMNSNNIDQ